MLCYSLRPYKLIYVFSNKPISIKTREDKNSAKVKEINRETADVRLSHCEVDGSDADVRKEMESEASVDQLATNMEKPNR